MKTPLLIFAAVSVSVILLSGGCKKEKIDVEDPIPQILSVTVSPGTIREFQDSVVFAVSYRDGDGDLGENSPDASNLFVVDNRIQITEEFRIQELAPAGAVIPIEGVLNVVLPSTGITDASSSQQVTYTVYVRDRAGNESNHFVTEPITVIR